MTKTSFELYKKRMEREERKQKAEELEETVEKAETNSIPSITNNDTKERKDDAPDYEFVYANEDWDKEKSAQELEDENHHQEAREIFRDRSQPSSHYSYRTILYMLKRLGKELEYEFFVSPDLGERSPSQYNGVPALLFAIFFGFLGLHRFYVGKFMTGFLMILVLVSGKELVIIWILYDIYCIVTGRFADQYGKIVRFR